MSNSSWEKVGHWYNNIVGEKGHFFHENLILPKALQILDIKNGDSIVDVGCGQGIFERRLGDNVKYTGLDSSSSLISFAKKRAKASSKFYCIDCCKPWPASLGKFNKALMMLSLQNMPDYRAVLSNISNHMDKMGLLVLIINHPYFRIPRQSSWGHDENTKIQYRRVDRYMSEMAIPIKTNPSENNSEVTWSFHTPLNQYSSHLRSCGFVINEIMEWTSPKKSVGKNSKHENLSRDEIPMFMCIECCKR